MGLTTGGTDIAELTVQASRNTANRCEADCHKALLLMHNLQTLLVPHIFYRKAGCRGSADDGDSS